VPSAQNIGARPNARTGGMVLVPQPWNISTLAWGWGSLVPPKSCRVWNNYLVISTALAENFTTRVTSFFSTWLAFSLNMPKIEKIRV